MKEMQKIFETKKDKEKEHCFGLRKAQSFFLGTNSVENFLFGKIVTRYPRQKVFRGKK